MTNIVEDIVPIAVGLAVLNAVTRNRRRDIVRRKIVSKKIISKKRRQAKLRW